MLNRPKSLSLSPYKRCLEDPYLFGNGEPKLDTVFQMGLHQGRVEGDDHLPQCAGHTLLNARQYAIGLLGHKATLLANLLSTRTPRSFSADFLSSRSAPNLY